MQSARVCVSWQVVPDPVQIDAEHVHADAAPVPVHASLLPQIDVTIHCVQPFPCVWHVSTEPPPVAHCIGSAVHWLVHEGPASPASP